MSENAVNRVRFLHCSDIHLDTPFAGLTAEKSEERRRDLRASFMRLMEYIRDREVDVVLISGDLFDTAYATNNTAEILIREFRNCPKTRFVIAPGKHDAYENNPIYASHRLPENCYVFSDSGLCRFDFQEFNLTVYGWAFMTDTLPACPLHDRTVDDVSRINVVCGYGDLNGAVDSDLCPIPKTDLKKFVADYYALGSRHDFSDFRREAGSTYSYCGSLECIGFEEPGLGGANAFMIEYDDGNLSIDVKHMSFGHVRFLTERIDITGVSANNEIVNRISRLISDKKYGIETALRVELVGNIDPRFLVPRNLECDAFGLYFFDMVDKTMPLYGTEHFKRDMNAAGEIYRFLLPMLESEDEEERLTAARAFRTGLSALEGRETDL